MNWIEASWDFGCPSVSPCLRGKVFCGPSPLGALENRPAFHYGGGFIVCREGGTVPNMTDFRLDVSGWESGVRESFEMSISAAAKLQIVQDFKVHDKDTGSPEVQIALITHRINELRSHFDAHKKDHSSRRGLLKLVSRRNQLLKYLTREDRTRYQQIIGRLGLRK